MDLNNEIEKLINMRATEIAYPDISEREMEKEEFLEIVERWGLSNVFLQKFLDKSKDCIATYKYRQVQIPSSVAIKIRQLDYALKRINK